jgi:Ca2+-binding RTX toxin-like protein
LPVGLARKAHPFVRSAVKAVVLSAMAVLVLLVPAAASAALVSEVTPGGQLIVESDASDSIAVTCGADGNVKVNGADPNTGPAACSAISHMWVIGGLGPNVIDLSGVTRASFPSLNLTPAIEPAKTVVSGGGGADTITGSEFEDSIDGREGDDTLNGGLADDSFLDGAGNNQIEGGPGVDDLLVFGTDGDDTLTALDGAWQVSTLRGTDTYSSIEVFSLHGFAGNDTITSGSGTDTLRGGEGNDVLNGGAGDDDLHDGAGKNQIEGGPGIDRLTFFGTDGDDTLTALDGAGQVSTVQTTDTYSSIEVFTVWGLKGNDTITSGSGGDWLLGGWGNDVLNGGAGDDVVVGDEERFFGHDVLNGGAGADRIWGGAGNDEITSRDDSSDSVNCGWDIDSVVADALDVIDSRIATEACETVDRGTPAEPSPQPPSPQPEPPPEPLPPPPPPAQPPPPQSVPKCLVPKVRGHTLRAAKAALRTRRCSAGRIARAYSAKVKRGRVMAQKPRAGTRLQVGGKVRLTVSRGRKR